MRKIIILAIGSILLTAIFTSPVLAGDDEIFGTGFGAVIGGLVGNQFGHGSGRIATTATGVFLGGLIGNEVGHSMDRVGSYHDSYYQGGYAFLPSPVYFQTAYAPNYVAPESPPPPSIYVDDSYGSYCREYSQQTHIGNEIHESYGTACLQPDGSWRVVE